MKTLLIALLALPGQEAVDTKVHFDVKAMAAPRPSLKYQFLPTIDEIETGSALQLYLKCFMEQNHFYHSKEANADREKWLTCPLKDLPLDKVRGYGGSSLRYADQAARMSNLDWQIVGDLRRKGAYTLLPEIQNLRSLANALKVRLRGEIAEKKFDEAAGTIKTLFKLSSQLGEHPTLIGNLVGLALVGLTIPAIEEMVQEGGPNLYWALATLPKPLVSLRHGVQGERMLFVPEMGRVPRDGRAPDGAVEKAITAIEQLLKDSTKGAPDLRAHFKKMAADAGHVEAARKRLVASGMAADAVKEMTVAQVAFLDDQLDFEERRDRMVRWLGQPFHLAAPRLAAEEKRRGGTLSGLLPAITKVHMAQARIEQRLNLLQVLEAARIHAAANKGELPKSLDDVDVPLPNDPATGKPFRYEVKDGTATLRGTPARGQEKIAPWNVIYTLKLVK